MISSVYSTVMVCAVITRRLRLALASRLTLIDRFNVSQYVSQLEKKKAIIGAQLPRDGFVLPPLRAQITISQQCQLTVANDTASVSLSLCGTKSTSVGYIYRVTPRDCVSLTLTTANSGKIVWKLI